MAVDWTKIYERYRGLWVGLKSDEKTIIASGKSVKEVVVLGVIDIGRAAQRQTPPSMMQMQ